MKENFRAKTVNEMFEEDVYGDPYVSDTTSPRVPNPKGDRMKDPASVTGGEPTIDYNGERGTVIDLFMKDNDPDLFAEIVEDEWGEEDPDKYEDDTYLIWVRSPEYDNPVTRHDSLWFTYGREGAYVPEQVNEGMDSYNDEGWTLQPGDKVIFRLRGMDSEFEAVDEEDIINYEGKVATIDSPETTSKIGDRDYEYYNIWFPGNKPGSGKMFYGVSGYHLFKMYI